MNRFRRATIWALLALAFGGALLLTLDHRPAPDPANVAAVAGSQAPNTPNARPASALEPTHRSTLDLTALHPHEDWPGLSGTWMYRCPVEFQPRVAGGSREVRMRVYGPGLPHRGWTIARDEQGTLRVPELAIGARYSFTILDDLHLLPGPELDRLAADRFELEPYAEFMADGRQPAMQVSLQLATRDARVRLYDADGRPLAGVEVVALLTEREPARLTCGVTHWHAEDGSIPLPIPLGDAPQDPFLRVLEPLDEFQDLPLSAWLLAEAADSGALVLTRNPPPHRVRFEVVHYDGSPALQSSVHDVADRRQLALPDGLGRCDFTTRARSFLICTPGYPDQIGLLTELAATDDALLDPWPQVRVVRPGTIALRLVVPADEPAGLAQLLIEAEGSDEVWSKDSRYSWSSISEDPWRGYAPFRARGRHTIEGTVERKFTITVLWWGCPLKQRELTLLPEQRQGFEIRPPAPERAPLGLQVRDSAGAALADARVEIGLPIPGGFASNSEQLEFCSLGTTDAGGMLQVPGWPDHAQPWLRVSSRRTGTSLTLALHEVLQRGGEVALPASRGHTPQ